MRVYDFSTGQLVYSLSGCHVYHGLDVVFWISDNHWYEYPNGQHAVYWQDGSKVYAYRGAYLPVFEIKTN